MPSTLVRLALNTVAPGSSGERYCRSTDLPKLVAVWPHEVMDLTVNSHRLLVAKLRRALRQERQRGLSGHWTYDLARHSQLLAAYKYEAGVLHEVAAGSQKVA